MRAPKFIFLSAYRLHHTAEANAAMHHALGNELSSRGLHAVEIEGAYQGTPEKSIMVNVRLSQPDAGHTLATCLHLAKRHKQDSILVVDAECQAWLVYPARATPEHLGTFHQTKAPLESLTAYSVLPGGSVWVCGNEG